MKGLLKLVSLLALQIALFAWPRRAACAPQATSTPKAQLVSGDRVVLSVGDQKMTAAEVEKLIQALPPAYRTFYSGSGKRFLAAFIVRMKVLSAEAIKQKLDQRPDVELALENARESILADTAQKHIEEGVTVSDQELRALYQKDKSLSQEVRIAHILVRTDDAALKSGDPSHPGLPVPEARKKLEDIRKQILAGADFAQMTKQYSEDAATAPYGGEMGFIQRDKVVPPIVNTAYALEPGQVSDLVATPSGFEIIKVEQKHTKTLEEIRPALEAQIRQERAGAIVQHLMEESGAVIDQEFFAAGHASEQSPPSSTPSH